MPYLARQPDALPEFLGGGRRVPESLGRKSVIRGFAVLAIVVTFAYLAWRTVATVDLGVWWVAVPLLLAEIHNAIGLVL